MRPGLCRKTTTPVSEPRNGASHGVAPCVQVTRHSVERARCAGAVTPNATSSNRRIDAGESTPPREVKRRPRTAQ